MPANRLLTIAVLLLAVLGAGCDAFGGSSPTATPSATPTITSTPTSTATATPPPRLEMASLEVSQGGFVVVRVLGSAPSGSVTFDGREYPLLRAPGALWAVLGVAADQSLGSYPLVVTLGDTSGAVADRLDGSLLVFDSAYEVEAITLAPELSGLLDPNVAAQEAALRDAVYATYTQERLWSGPFVLPVNDVVTSPYGIGRSYNGGPVASFHSGTDFAADETTPIGAANAGRVAFASELPIRGLSVIIDHGAGVFSGYHHLSSTTVVEGQMVGQGDLIGYGGDSGLVTGPHLHWEILVRGVPVDATLWTLEEVGP